MYKIKLLDHQLQAIQSRLDHSYDQIEDMLLNKYNTFCLSDLNSTDYDDIIEDIQEWNSEITSNL